MKRIFTVANDSKLDYLAFINLSLVDTNIEQPPFWNSKRFGNNVDKMVTETEYNTFKEITTPAGSSYSRPGETLPIKWYSERS